MSHLLLLAILGLPHLDRHGDSLRPKTALTVALLDLGGPSSPAEKVRQWIVDLGADRYAVRGAAAKELQGLGRLAEPDLRAAHDQATSEEVRTRLDALLAKIMSARSSAELIQARAVAAMEAAATPEARKLLPEWAGGAPGARLTIDARAALGRVAGH